MNNDQAIATQTSLMKETISGIQMIKIVTLESEMKCLVAGEGLEPPTRGL